MFCVCFFSRFLFFSSVLTIFYIGFETPRCSYFLKKNTLSFFLLFWNCTFTQTHTQQVCHGTVCLLELCFLFLFHSRQKWERVSTLSFISNTHRKTKNGVCMCQRLTWAELVGWIAQTKQCSSNSSIAERKHVRHQQQDCVGQMRCRAWAHPPVVCVCICCFFGSTLYNLPKTLNLLILFSMLFNRLLAKCFTPFHTPLPTTGHCLLLG